MKKLLTYSVLLLTLLISATATRSVNAATFSPGQIITDSAFIDSSSMNIAQIDAFLNTFQYSCISPNSGFESILPIGYTPTGGFTYGGYVSAGSVIATAAQVFEINPRVLLTTLEKEQSLVTGQNNSTYCLPSVSSNHKFAAAAGYGCPDSGTTFSYTGLSLYRRNGIIQTDVGPTCVNTSIKAGFSQQVIRAAWLLRFGQERSRGNTAWAIVKPSWNNSDDPATCYGGPMTAGNRKRCSSDATATFYDGYTSIDAVSTLMGSGATAALYWYTPHFHGNQLFFNIFVGWFGDPNTPCFGTGNITTKPSGFKLLATRLSPSLPSMLNFTLQNNSGSSCVESHVWTPGYQSWAAHYATAMKAIDPSLGTLVSMRFGTSKQEGLTYVMYNNGASRVEIHKFSPDTLKFPGFYDVATNLAGVTATSGTFVAGDFFGRGYDQLTYVLYSNANNRVEIHMFDPTLQKAVGYYDVETNLSNVTVTSGTFVAGDFFGRGYDQLAYVLYSSNSGRAEIHMFDPTLQKAVGYYDVETDLTAVTSSIGTFVSGDFLGRGNDQMMYVLYAGNSGKVEVHTFSADLRRAIGIQDLPTNLQSFDPAQ